jgi:hypothetical protein
VTIAHTRATKITVSGYEKELCRCDLQLWFLYYFVASKITEKKRDGVPRVSCAVAVVQCVWLTSRLFDKHIVVAGRYQR